MTEPSIGGGSIDLDEDELAPILPNYLSTMNDHPSPYALPVMGEGTLVVTKDSLIDGLGAFAERDITKGTRVIEYVGERISKTESMERCEKGNAFIFSLDEMHDVDGQVEWNPARFLNHSCEPNCEA